MCFISFSSYSKTRHPKLRIVVKGANLKGPGICPRLLAECDRGRIAMWICLVISVTSCCFSLSSWVNKPKSTFDEAKYLLHYVILCYLPSKVRNLRWWVLIATFWQHVCTTQKLLKGCWGVSFLTHSFINSTFIEQLLRVKYCVRYWIKYERDIEH